MGRQYNQRRLPSLFARAKRMKILLLGKDGQVGTELRRTLLPLGEVVSFGRDNLNLEDLSGLNYILTAHKPNIIVNAAAYTTVDKAESDKETAFLINSVVIKVLADYTEKNNSLLIHYSTDYVFDGEKSGAYFETDKTNPQSIYGASKRAGEEAILASGCNFLIFRTSWVFSASGKNFIKTILTLAKEKENLRVISDQNGTPTSAELIADITALAISSYNNNSICNGIYHLTATGVTSWYKLACYVVEKALEKGMSLKLNSRHIKPISTAEYPLPAKRPLNSTLDTTALSCALSLNIPHWSIYVDRTVEQLAQKEKLA